MTYKSRQVYDVFYYITDKGHCPFDDWLGRLKDVSAAARITVRIDRLALGHLGDCKPIQKSVWELRVHTGPGYRIYYGVAGKNLILILCGGDKRSQKRDIQSALAFWLDYKKREEKK